MFNESKINKKRDIEISEDDSLLELKHGGRIKKRRRAGSGELPVIHETPFLLKDKLKKEVDQTTEKIFSKRLIKSFALAVSLGVGIATFTQMVNREINDIENDIKNIEVLSDDNSDLGVDYPEVEIVYENQDAIIENSEELTEDEMIVKRHDDDETVKSILEIMDYEQSGRIIFDEKSLLALREHWKIEYLRYGNNTKKIIARRDTYKESLEEIFTEEGVPVEFLDVASTESNFKPGTLSKKNAGGYYQFLPATGRSFGLVVNDEIDERNDPLKSGRACAKYLKSLHKRYGDWNLVLTRYNGAKFTRDYYNSQSGENLSYAGYLKFRENRINSIRESIQKGNSVDYKVKNGNSLESIASKYKVSSDDLVVENNLESDKIHPGRVLKIPILNQTHAKHVFKIEMSDSIENMRYPAKFFGFRDAVNIIEMERDEEEHASVSQDDENF